jgi:preprotein translocase subunit SecA
MWGQLLETIRHNIARSIYHVGLATSAPAVPRAPDQQNLRENRQEEAALPAARSAATGRKVGRNDPCPCGSGRKYKRCHGVAA